MQEQSFTFCIIPLKDIKHMLEDFEEQKYHHASSTQEKHKKQSKKLCKMPYIGTYLIKSINSSDNKLQPKINPYIVKPAQKELSLYKRNSAVVATLAFAKLLWHFLSNYLSKYYATPLVIVAVALNLH